MDERLRDIELIETSMISIIDRIPHSPDVLEIQELFQPWSTSIRFHSQKIISDLLWSELSFRIIHE